MADSDSESNLETTQEVDDNSTFISQAPSDEKNETIVHEDSSMDSHMFNINYVSRKRKGPTMTVPETPMLMKRELKFRRSQHLTAEERELNHIKELKMQLARKKLDCAKLKQKVLNIQGPAYTKKPPTKPIGFNFATDNRLKEIDASKKDMDFKEVDFVKSLRKQDDFNFNPCRTIPEPFIFHGNSSKENKCSEKVETFAEKCAKFASKTPERFHTRPTKEMEKRKSWQDTSVLPMNLNESHQFYARPLPLKILQGPVGLKPRKEMPVTIPISPAFSVLHASKRTEVKPEPENIGVPKICPLPSSTAPFKPQLERRKVESVPFSFESRDKEMIQKKEGKIRQVLEAEKQAREFYANPLPSLEPALPTKRPKPITVTEAFDFEIDKRVALQHEKWQKKLEEEKRLEKENATFHARPATVLQMQPFVPEKPSYRVDASSLLEKEMHIPTNLEKRVASWKENEKWMQQKQALLEEAAFERELRHGEQEREDLKKFRAEAVHKAQPIRSYKALHLESSEKPLTRPQAPNFSERLTARYTSKLKCADQSTSYFQD